MGKEKFFLVIHNNTIL